MISILRFLALTPSQLQLTSLSHRSTPLLDRLPLRSGDLSFEAEITGTLASPSGECSKPAKLYSSGVLPSGTQCDPERRRVPGSGTGLYR